jgi:hypothetical protein
LEQPKHGQDVPVAEGSEPTPDEKVEESSPEPPAEPEIVEEGVDKTIDPTSVLEDAPIEVVRNLLFDKKYLR